MDIMISAHADHGNIAADIADRVDAIMPHVIELRRRLHAHPEASGGEKNTAAHIASILESEGIRVNRNIGGHGMLATISTVGGDDWIALRGDMDALPIHDGKSACQYRSTIDGVAHACGHDAHSAILTGAAIILNGMRDQLPQHVACIYQPAEETTEGAMAMLDDGLLNTIKPKRIHALHVYPYLPSGSIGLRDGIMCAAADMFEVEVEGRGGHAARPHECVDVILISRRVNPMHPAVLTVGQIRAGSAANVIPDRVHFSGTVRSLNPETHEEIRSRMDRIIRQTAETWGAVAHFNMKQAIPMLENDASVMHVVRSQLAACLPDSPVIDIEEPSMGGEDFACFLQQIPGALIRLGTGGGPATRYPLHHPNFDIDERAMATGIAALVSFCLAGNA
jgi:amidohydrolase